MLEEGHFWGRDDNGCHLTSFSGIDEVFTSVAFALAWELTTEHKGREEWMLARSTRILRVGFVGVEVMVFVPPMMSTLFALFFDLKLMLSLALLFGSSTMLPVMEAIRIVGLGIREESSDIGVVILPVSVLECRTDTMVHIWGHQMLFYNFCLLSMSFCEWEYLLNGLTFLKNKYNALFLTNCKNLVNLRARKIIILLHNLIQNPIIENNLSFSSLIWP